MSESGKKPPRKSPAGTEWRDGRRSTPRAQRLDGLERVWSGTADTATDPNLEPWLVEELRRVYDDVLYEPIPEDMLDILRRAGADTESREESEARRRQSERERAIAEFKTSGGDDSGSAH